MFTPESKEEMQSVEAHEIPKFNQTKGSKATYYVSWVLYGSTEPEHWQLHKELYIPFSEPYSFLPSDHWHPGNQSDMWADNEPSGTFDKPKGHYTEPCVMGGRLDTRTGLFDVPCTWTMNNIICELSRDKCIVSPSP